MRGSEGRQQGGFRESCLLAFLWRGCVGNIQNLISVATPQTLFFQKQARFFELRFIENSFFEFPDFVR